jgi:hypothetical protein
MDAEILQKILNRWDDHDNINDLDLVRDLLPFIIEVVRAAKGRSKAGHNDWCPDMVKCICGHEALDLAIETLEFLEIE